MRWLLKLAKLKKLIISASCWDTVLMLVSVFLCYVFINIFFIFVVCPYLAFEAMLKLKRDGVLDKTLKNVTLIDNYIKASNDGIKKVMSKMGISTLQSYKGETA